jgi:Domain of unknown function (DUF4864)
MTQRRKIATMLCCLAICGSAAITHRWLDMRRRAVRPAELYETVWKQIRAFRAADFSGAYQHASADFQEKVNLEAFVELVRSEYPDLVRAERVEFGSVRSVGRHAILQVYFFMPDGDVVPCIYTLVNEEDRWKIDGARLQKRWPAGRRLGGIRT